MHELDRIRLALTDAASRGESAVLATVVAVDGSTYRGAGARMVVRADGSTTGAVSGGCLEADIVARAAAVLAAGSPELAHYDTRSDDGILGLGMGCQGVIDVRLEPLAGVALRAEIDRLAELRARNATRFLVCGAGADAIPVVRLAAATGWLVTVVDHRPSFATAERFPDAERVLRLDNSETDGMLASMVSLNEFAAAVVMGHAATHDRARLHELLGAPALRYIGVLGPRRRTKELLEGAPGVAPGALPEHVFAPVGLDIGAETPEEIALAIVSECAAVLAGRAPRSLRERGGPIHDKR
ncbi:MAG TPA: XdhC family protein [Gemmatimonadaceae bacterium]|nr:XdhC family protein [Gemmatimonadaceae bacterium]